MDVFHALLIGVVAVVFFLLLRERNKKKSAELWYEGASKLADKRQQELQEMAKAWVLSIVPPEKVAYRPAEERIHLNFVYPPPAPEMLVIRNPSAEEKAIMDQINMFFRGKLRAAENFSWIQIPGPVTEEERIRYSKP